MDKSITHRAAKIDRGVNVIIKLSLYLNNFFMK